MFSRSDPFFQLHDIITSGGKLTKRKNYISDYEKQLKVNEPPKRTKGIMVADVAELVQKLKYEAKVI